MNTLKTLLIPEFIIPALSGVLMLVILGVNLSIHASDSTVHTTGFAKQKIESHKDKLNAHVQYSKEELAKKASKESVEMLKEDMKEIKGDVKEILKRLPRR